ncbi:hypothetical protein ANRL2_04617 [Anaerolineae bacterium]|nr:hypothetical protein ANRL2_04617 [Anaerolineae bacterium]
MAAFAMFQQFRRIITADDKGHCTDLQSKALPCWENAEPPLAA